MIEIVTENCRKIVLGEFEHKVFILGYAFILLKAVINYYN